MKIFSISIALMITIVLFGYADESIFSPSKFPGIADSDLDAKFRVITGSGVGAEVLASSSDAAFVFLDSRKAKLTSFSFNFDRILVSKYFKPILDDRSALLKLLKEPRSYGPEEQAFSEDLEGDKLWEQQIALEIATDKTFLRMYFDARFSQCYFVSCTGECGNRFRVSPDLRNCINNLVKKSHDNWIDVLPQRPLK